MGKVSPSVHTILNNEKAGQSYVSKCESGERRVDFVELLDFASIYKKSIEYFMPYTATLPTCELWIGESLDHRHASVHVLDDLELGFGRNFCPPACLISKTMGAHKLIWSIYAERTLIIF